MTETRSVKLNVLDLHMGQNVIAKQLGQRNLLRCGRRFGKTTLLETVFARKAAEGRKIGWFTPEYKLMTPTYARLYNICSEFITRSSQTAHIIELMGGGCVEFWTLDNEDAGRSRFYDDVVIDEGSLKKKGLEDIIEQAIKPTLLDRNGTLTMAGTPKGVDPDNFFYMAATDPKHVWTPEKPSGYRQFWSPTTANPTLNQEGVAALKETNEPNVYLQEYMAEFVDWSGTAFFALPSMLDHEEKPFPIPTLNVETVFATIDTAIKTGREHDGTAVVYWALVLRPEPKLYILDWDIVQIEGSLLEAWLPGVYLNLDRFQAMTKAALPSTGAYIEDKASGMILLQQAARRNWPASAIDSLLTAVGKDERAISVSGYVFRKMVRMCFEPYHKTTNYKGQTANHFRKQVVGYRVGMEADDDDLLDCFTYGVAIGLGDSGGN